LRVRHCQAKGYFVLLVFVGLESADLSRGRVMQRVEAGGHDVPDGKIDSRFPRTFANLRQAITGMGGPPPLTRRLVRSPSRAAPASVENPPSGRTTKRREI